MLKLVDPESFDDLVIRAWLAVAQNACLRVSEYACDHTIPKHLTKEEKRNVLRWSDFKIDTTQDGTQYGTIRFDKSKTNWNRDEEFANLPCRCPNPCGLHELLALKNQAFLRFGPEAANHPIFQWHDRRVLSKTQAFAMLKNLSARVGLDPTLYATHSLRKGGIVDAIIEGASDAVLLNMGRWKSFDSIKSYIKLEQHHLAAIRSRHFRSAVFDSTSTLRTHRPSTTTHRTTQHAETIGYGPIRGTF